MAIEQDDKRLRRILFLLKKKSRNFAIVSGNSSMENAVQFRVKLKNVIVLEEELEVILTTGWKDES